MARVNRLRSALLGALLACAAAPSWAMPPLLAVVVTYGIQYAVATAVITAAVGAALTAGVFISTLVFGMVEQRKARNKARSAYNATLTDRYAPVMSAADGAWQVIYGEAVVGPCQVPAQLTSGSRDEFKHVVYIWAAHECEAITDTLIAGVSVGALDAAGWVTGGKYFKSRAQESESLSLTLNGAGVGTLPYAPSQVVNVAWSPGLGENDVWEYLTAGQFTVVGTTLTVGAPYVAAWAGRVVYANTLRATGTALLRVRHHLGSDSQTADTALLADCPADWTSSDRLRGLCYSVITYSLDEPEFQGGPPDAKARVKGKKLYDHRTGLTVWSDTAALCVADFLRAAYGKRATTNQMGWASTDATANACEEALASQGGAKRYTINGAFRTDMDPDATLDALCQAMAGFVTWDGTWNMQAGVYTAPVLAITDADNAGSVDVAADKPGDEVFNGLKGRFYDPARFDQLTDYTPYRNAAFSTADGGDLWDDLDLPFTNAHWRAHNLARIQVERSRGMQLVYPAKLRAIKLKPGQRVTLSCSLLGISESVFRVVKRDYKIGQPVKLTLQQDDASMYDESDAPAPLDSPASNQPDPFYVAPVTGLAVLSGDTTYQKMNDGTIISRVLVTVTASTDALVTAHGALQIEYRTESETVWSRWPEAPGTTTKVALQGLKDNRRYIIRARWRNGLGAVGDWRVIDVLVWAKSQPPANVTGLSATIGPGGVVYKWNANGEEDYKFTELHVEATWNDATVPLAKVASNTFTYAWPPLGALTVLAKHVDTTGHRSATAANSTITIDEAALIKWGDVTGRPGMWRVVSQGSSDTNSPAGSGIYNAETAGLIHSGSRSYNFARISRATLAITYHAAYDVYATGATAAAALAAALNATDSDYFAVVWTEADPFASRLLGALPAALYRCGASQAVFGSPQFRAQAAYILIGIGGVGEGNGFEAYNGAVDNDTNAWCDVSFYVQNGNLIVSGMTAVPRSLADHGYTGDLDATRDVNLVARGICQAQGNNATATGGGAWGSGDVYSTDSFTGGAWCSFVPSTTGGAMAGLNGDPITDQNYTSIDFAIYVATGTYYVYESGTLRYTGVAFTAGDVFAVVYDGYGVRYLRNGTTVYHSAATIGPNLRLFFDSAFYNTAALRNIRFGPMSKISEIETQQIDPNAITDSVLVTDAGPVSAISAYTELIRASFGPYEFDVEVDVWFTGQANLNWGTTGPANMYAQAYIDPSAGANSPTVKSDSWYDTDAHQAVVSITYSMSLAANTSGYARTMGKITVAGGGSPVGDWVNLTMAATVRKR